LSPSIVQNPGKSTGTKKDDFHFQVNLVTEAELSKGFLKTGVVHANVPGCGAFELRCDEGNIIGGTDSAPAPLDYLSAGIAFCFLSHVSIYIKQNTLQVEGVRVEQQMRLKLRFTKCRGQSKSLLRGAVRELQPGYL